MACILEVDRVRGWMPTDTDPTAAYIDNKRIIHIQGYNGGPTNGSQANKQGPGLIPLKMVAQFCRRG